jgi:hypothetical protein
MAQLRQAITTIAGNQVQYPDWTSVDIKRAVLRATGPNPDTNATNPLVDYEIEFPFGPKDLSHQNYGGTYQQIQRPYLKPLNVYSAPRLRTVTFDAIIVHRPSGGMDVGPMNEFGESVQDVLDSLELISSSGATCEFSYGTQVLPYSSYLTQFSYTVKYRNKDGEPLRAQASIQLTEKSVYNPYLVTLPMIERPPVEKAIPTKDEGDDDLVPEALAAQFGQSAAEMKASALELSTEYGISVDDAYLLLIPLY